MNKRIYCCKEDRHCSEIVCCRFCPKYNQKTQYIRKDGSSGVLSSCYHECSDAWKKRCKFKCLKGKAETVKMMDKLNPKPRPKLVLSAAATAWINGA